MKRPRTRFSSPTPPPSILPAFLPPPEQASDIAHDKSEVDSKRATFRKIWMSKVVEAFEGDLDHIRQNEPTLSATRLGTLIDSLAAGIDIFSDHESPATNSVDEVGFIIDTAPQP